MPYPNIQELKSKIALAEDDSPEQVFYVGQLAEAHFLAQELQQFYLDVMNEGDRHE
jgi:hypothetical protein